MRKQYIVCAALRGRDGTILCGARHYDGVMHSQIKHMSMPDQFLRLSGDNQGFIDNFGEYFTRKEAFIIAQDADQLRGDKHTPKDILFSEDLY